MLAHRAGPAAILVALSLLAVPARAQDVSPDILRGYLGAWLVAGDDGKPGCRVTLAAGRTVGGRQATPEPACAARLPRVAQAASWSIESGVILRDAARKPLLAFIEDETTTMKTREGSPAYYLVQAKAGVDRAPHAPALSGRWSLERPGGPALCVAVLRDRPAPGAEESFGLAIEPGCDAAVARLKLASWRIEDFRVMLYGRDGQSLAFEPGPDGRFEKVAEERGRPLLMRRLP